MRKAPLAKAWDDTLPIENVLYEGVSSLHVHIPIGTSLPKYFVKVKHMLKNKGDIYVKRNCFPFTYLDVKKIQSCSVGTSQDTRSQKGQQLHGLIQQFSNPSVSGALYNPKWSFGKLHWHTCGVSGSFFSVCKGRVKPSWKPNSTET